MLAEFVIRYYSNTFYNLHVIISVHIYGNNLCRSSCCYFWINFSRLLLLLLFSFVESLPFCVKSGFKRVERWTDFVPLLTNVLFIKCFLRSAQLFAPPYLWENMLIKLWKKKNQTQFTNFFLNFYDISIFSYNSVELFLYVTDQFCTRIGMVCVCFFLPVSVRLFVWIMLWWVKYGSFFS